MEVVCLQPLSAIYSHNREWWGCLVVRGGDVMQYIKARRVVRRSKENEK